MAMKSWRRMGVAGAAIAALTIGALAPAAAHADPITRRPESAPALRLQHGRGGDGRLRPRQQRHDPRHRRDRCEWRADPAGWGIRQRRRPRPLPGRTCSTARTRSRSPPGCATRPARATTPRCSSARTGQPAVPVLAAQPAQPAEPHEVRRHRGTVPDARRGAPSTGSRPPPLRRASTAPPPAPHWTMYTTVITANTRSRATTTALSSAPCPRPRTVTQFGTGLVGYIGRSSYPDIFYKGGVDDVIVSTSAYTPHAGRRAVPPERPHHHRRRPTPPSPRTPTRVSLPSETIADIALPVDRRANQSRITWASSHAGGHRRPTARSPVPPKDKPTQSVTLTAHLHPRRPVRRPATSTVTVPAVDPQRDLERTADAFDLGIKVVADDIVLTSESQGDIAIAWAVVGTGRRRGRRAPSRAAGRRHRRQLTATFSRAGHTTAAHLQRHRQAQDAGQAVAYVRTGDTAKTEVLHLAAAQTATRSSRSTTTRACSTRASAPAPRGSRTRPCSASPTAPTAWSRPTTRRTAASSSTARRTS